MKLYSETAFSNVGKDIEALYFQQPKRSFICEQKHDKAAFRKGLLYFSLQLVAVHTSILNSNVLLVNAWLLSPLAWRWW